METATTTGALQKTLSFKPKKEQESFLIALIEEKKSINQAIIYCVDTAMKPSEFIPVGLSTDKKMVDMLNERNTLKGQVSDLKNEIDEHKILIKELRESTSSSFDEIEQKSLSALMEKKGLKDIHAALKYALTYTLKNDWI